MLIGFVGCPSSGKTTTAAMLFADLKLGGQASEFVPEQARIYIAEKKNEAGFLRVEFKGLGDRDQVEIISRQNNLESLLKRNSAPDTIIVADTATLNTLLYMSPETRQLPEVREIVTRSMARYDLLFYCSPVLWRAPEKDSLRIHDQEQSLILDKSIPEVIDMRSIIRLPVSPHERQMVIRQAIYDFNAPPKVKSFL